MDGAASTGEGLCCIDGKLFPCLILSGVDNISAEISNSFFFNIMNISFKLFTICLKKETTKKKIVI